MGLEMDESEAKLFKNRQDSIEEKNYFENIKYFEQEASLFKIASFKYPSNTQYRIEHLI